MVPFTWICIFASLAFAQADLRSYNDQILHDKTNEFINKKFVAPVSNNVDGLRGEERSDLNDDLNLVGDDRIPLDYDINEKSSEIKEMNHGLQTGLANIALSVVKDVLFNQAKAQFDFKECIGAMSNIIEEEHLADQIKNLTIDAMKIISNATQTILECQEQQSFSSCVTVAVNLVGPAFIAVTEDIEQAFFAMIVVGEKLFQQVKLCIGRTDVPVSDILYSLLHLIQFNDNARLKKESEVSNVIPNVAKKNDEIVVPKRNPLFNKDNWFNNLDII